MWPPVAYCHYGLSCPVPKTSVLCLWLLLGELQLLQDKGTWWCNWCCGCLPLPGLCRAHLRLLPDCALELSWGRWRKGCVLRSCSDLGLGSRLGNLVAYVDVKLCATKCFCVGCLVSLLSLPSAQLWEMVVSRRTVLHFKCLQLCSLKGFWS